MGVNDLDVVWEDPTAAERLDSDKPVAGGCSSFQGKMARARSSTGVTMNQTSLLSHVLDAPITVLYGGSGLGKTVATASGPVSLLLRDRHLAADLRALRPRGRVRQPLARQLHQLRD